MFAQRMDTSSKPRGRAALFALAALVVAPPAMGQSRTFTTDTDFDAGVLEQVNHSLAHDQLQLDVSYENFSFLWIPNSSRGTLARVDARTGAVLGEYRTAPLGRSRNASRTAIDAMGNVWTANRSEAATNRGSVVEIGLVLGGTRVTKRPDGSIVADPLGGYLAPPFKLCTAVDRNGDGLIRTSRGLGDVLAWPDVTDGEGGADGLVQDAEDECILVFQRTSAPGATHVSLDGHGHVWVGAYPSGVFDVLDATSGAVQGTLSLANGGFGGVIDAQGVLWSSSPTRSSLLRYDTVAGSTMSIAVLQSSGVTPG